MYDGTRTLDDEGRKKYVNRAARRQGKADYITPWKYLNQLGGEESKGVGGGIREGFAVETLLRV